MTELSHSSRLFPILPPANLMGTYQYEPVGQKYIRISVSSGGRFIHAVIATYHQFFDRPDAARFILRFEMLPLGEVELLSRSLWLIVISAAAGPVCFGFSLGLETVNQPTRALVERKPRR